MFYACFMLNNQVYSGQAIKCVAGQASATRTSGISWYVLDPVHKNGEVLM